MNNTKKIFRGGFISSEYFINVGARIARPFFNFKYKIRSFSCNQTVNYSDAQCAPYKSCHLRTTKENPLSVTLPQYIFDCSKIFTCDKFCTLFCRVHAIGGKICRSLFNGCRSKKPI